MRLLFSHTDELNITKKRKKKGSIDRRGTCINISDEMIDDRISKSLWHRRKIAFACECLVVRGA